MSPRPTARSRSTDHPQRAPSTGRSQSGKGAARRAELLQVAERLMVEEGAGALTMRRVAEEAGIRLGNLQYYFPTKDALIDALVDELCARYVARMAAETEPNLSPEAALAAFAQFIVSDFRSREGSVIFWELWALSAHSEGVAHAVNRLHELERAHIAAILEQLRPQLSSADRRLRAVAIVALLEGSGLFVGPGRSHAKRAGPVVTEIAEAALAIAMR